MNRVITDLELSKGSLYYKPKGYPKERKSNKTRDPIAKKAINEICNKKRTYGSPRVRAVLARDHKITLSRYMVSEIMREEGQLITVGPRRPQKEHTGIIEVKQSNTRWASDITSIKTWDNQKYRFAFIIDCCDRNIITWKFSKHIQASDIELLVQYAISKRFDGKNAQGLEFLHDNGPEYIEKKLKAQLKEWNINNCNTPTYSPQSNGMSEAFNGTFKRDYVYMSCLDNYEVVAEQIPKWIDEYNTYAPHSALNMKTPAEFLQERIAA